MRDLQARLGFLVILHLPGNVKCTPSTALDDFFARHFADGRFWRTARSRPNENKMSDGGRGRALLGVKVWKSSQKCSVRRFRRSLHRMVRSLWVYWRPWRNDLSAAP